MLDLEKSRQEFRENERRVMEAIGRPVAAVLKGAIVRLEGHWAKGKEGLDLYNFVLKRREDPDQFQTTGTELSKLGRVIMPENPMIDIREYLLAKQPDEIYPAHAFLTVLIGRPDPEFFRFFCQVPFCSLEMGWEDAKPEEIEVIGDCPVLSPQERQYFEEVGRYHQ